MPLVEISIWKENVTDDIRENLISQVSDTVSKVSGAPLDKVLGNHP